MDFGQAGVTGETDKEELPRQVRHGCLSRVEVYFNGAVADVFDGLDHIQISFDQKPAQDGAIEIASQGQEAEKQHVVAQRGDAGDGAGNKERVNAAEKKGQAHEFVGEAPDLIGDIDVVGEDHQGNEKEEGGDAEILRPVGRRNKLRSGELD